jgi:hypothetical protein
LFAQPVEQYVKIIVAPDHQNWTYGAGVRSYEPAIEMAERGMITFKIGIKRDVFHRLIRIIC